MSKIKCRTKPESQNSNAEENVRAKSPGTEHESSLRREERVGVGPGAGQVEVLLELARQIEASLLDPAAASDLVERISDYLVEGTGPLLNLNVPKALPTSQKTVELVLTASTASSTPSYGCP